MPIGSKGDYARNVTLGNPVPASNLPAGVPISTETGTPQQYLGALEGRRAEVARINSNSAKQYVFEAFFEVRGIGEVTKVVYFPVRYIEQPLFYFGSSLSEDSNYIDGSVPTCSVTVLKWSIEVPNDGDDDMRQYYTGCRIGAVMAGPLDTNMVVHMHFSGVGLVNPSGNLPGLDETL